MSITKDAFEGRISKAYVKKEILKNIIGLFAYVLILEIPYLVFYFTDPEFSLDLLILLTNTTVITPYIVIALVSAWFFFSIFQEFLVHCRRE